MAAALAQTYFDPIINNKLTLIRFILAKLMFGTETCWVMSYQIQVEFMCETLVKKLHCGFDDRMNQVMCAWKYYAVIKTHS